MLAQGLHDFIALLGSHLNDHTQLFIEQGFERHLFAAGADLRGPIFTVAILCAAVGDAVALGE